MSQVDQNHSLHNIKAAENSTQQHVSHHTENERVDQEAEMDALESRLFAMAGSRC